jgi:hypothetical protein
MAFLEKGTDKEACTALKTVSNSNQHLSSQADKKSHILIQVSALMVSVLLVFVLRITREHRIVLVPVFELMATCLAVIVLALMATRPRMLSRSSVQAQAAGVSGVNLLFFGSYDELEPEEYHADMELLMADADLLYSNLTRDIYFQAVVLGKKYKFLRMAYHVFMIGLALSVLSFIIIAFL